MTPEDHVIDPASSAHQPGPNKDRRWFLGAVFASSAIVATTFAGANIGGLTKLALLPSRRADFNTQGLPVQTRATKAGLVDVVQKPDYRVHVTGAPVRRPLELSVDDLHAMPQRSAALPISCVQGWSVAAHWRGVPLRDVLDEAGVTDFEEIIVVSAQKRVKPEAMFSSARLNRAHALHPDTLLALELNDEILHIDHGYPTRLISPANPGIMQTKWVEYVEVR